MKVLGISGSLRAGSHNRRLLRAAADLLPPGVELELFEGLGEIPPFNEDEEGSPPAAVLALKQTIADTDLVLISTPEYNHSIPGALKNALDWVSRPMAENPMRGKWALVIGASTGMFGAVWAQAELRKVLAAAGGRVLDRELPVPAADEAFTDDDRLVEAEHHDELAAIVEALVIEAQPRFATAA
jgi:chromate reductase